MIELYRCIIPANKIINDNHGQHYRIHMGNIDWLTNQFNRILAKDEPGPGGFIMPDIETVKQNTNEILKIRCEVWRCRNTLFDPQNYAKTFKAPIDLLVFNGYIPDDNWKFINGITYVGGGRNVWKDRAVRLENDGLPEDFSPEWWNQYSGDYNDLFIRIIAE